MQSSGIDNSNSFVLRDALNVDTVDGFSVAGTFGLKVSLGSDPDPPVNGTGSCEDTEPGSDTEPGGDTGSGGDSGSSTLVGGLLSGSLSGSLSRSPTVVAGPLTLLAGSLNRVTGVSVI